MFLQKSMHNPRKSIDCIVTVFLAVAFTCVMTLILALTESARISAVRYYARIAAASAADSLFSNYHNDLWDKYRLLFLEAENEDNITALLEEYTRKYRCAENWFRFNDPEFEISRMDVATSGDGEWLEQEIIDYMNYAAAAQLIDSFDETDVNPVYADLQEANTMKDITESYSECSGEAAAMEKAVSAISENLTSQRRKRSAAIGSWNAGNWSSFRTQARALRADINKLPALIDTYDRMADKLQKKLNKISADRHMKESNLGTESLAALNEAETEYDAYMVEDELRSSRIEALDDKNDINIVIIDETIEESFRVEEEEEEALAREAEARAEAEAAGKEYSGGISFTIPHCDLDRVYIAGISFSYGIKDEKTEGILEAAAAIFTDSLLQMVIPEGRRVSQTLFETAELPSCSLISEREGAERNLAEIFLIGQYVSEYMKEFTDMRRQDDGNVGSSPEYEIEYILGGKETDKENLEEAVGQLFAIREGMNYMHIMRSSVKRNEVRSLAAAIVGSAGMPFLIPLMEFLIIGVWAAAESVIDLRALLSGEKVSLFKTDSEWKTGLSGMISQLTSAADSGNNGKPEMLSGDISGDEKGVSYENYLIFLNLLLSARDRNYRMMDVIQMNIREKDAGFSMNKCIYAMTAEMAYSVSGVFTDISVQYMMTETSRAY